MARKRLIKGANAVRVEERIARVPVDVSLPEFESGSGIFDALRAMEADRSEAPAPQATAALLRMDPKPTTPRVEKDAVEPKPKAPKVAKVPVEPKPKVPKVLKAPKVPVEKKPKLQKIKAERNGTAVPGRSAKRKPTPVSAPTAATVPAVVPAVAPTPSPTRAAESPQKPTKPGRIGTSDFTAKERETIIRCCSDYRNHLPIYLLAVQMEVEIIDSVIEKCLASAIRPRKI